MSTPTPNAAIAAALALPACTRLREWASIGPVQRAEVQSFADALLAALAQQVPEPQGDPHDREPIYQATIDCWRINYGLDKRTPAEAAKWWQDSFHGHAPSGCVAALGVALDELESERKARGAQQVPAVPEPPTLADVLDALNVFNPPSAQDRDNGAEPWAADQFMAVTALPAFIHNVGRAWYAAPLPTPADNSSVEPATPAERK